MVADGASSEGESEAGGDPAELLVNAYGTCMRVGGKWLARRYPSVPPTWREWIAEEAFERTATRWLADPELAARNLLAYYLTVVRNLAIDLARGGRPIAIPQEPGKLEPGAQPWVLQSQVEREDALLLRTVVIPEIRRMRPSQRRSVVEMQSCGADDTAIATALGIPRQQVQVQRVRAIRELRQKLRKLIRLKEGHKRQRGERDSGE
ncbi:hypothetical protein AB0469_25910 [Streptomyces sp. NPDC093801]|uniref:hypothetical protein n=1 Tax=Streptomyces sp. NPDC093801 TaxID=3155203 RepID=UPI00344B1D16